MQPAWKTWTPEPWDATLNGTVHRSGLYLGDMDEKEKADPSYASDLDVANAKRLVACVNALADVRHPAAVPEALAALAETAELLRRLVSGADTEAAGVLARAGAAVSALSENPA